MTVHRYMMGIGLVFASVLAALFFSLEAVELIGVPEAALIFGMLSYIFGTIVFRPFIKRAIESHWHREYNAEDFTGKGRIIALLFVVIVAVLYFYRAKSDPEELFMLGMALAAVFMPAPSEPEVFTHE